MNEKCINLIFILNFKEFLTPRDYALQNGKNQFVELIDKVKAFIYSILISLKIIILYLKRLQSSI